MFPPCRLSASWIENGTDWTETTHDPGRREGTARRAWGSVECPSETHGWLAHLVDEGRMDWATLHTLRRIFFSSRWAKDAGTGTAVSPLPFSSEGFESALPWGPGAFSASEILPFSEAKAVLLGSMVLRESGCDAGGLDQVEQTEGGDEEGTRHVFIERRRISYPVRATRTGGGERKKGITSNPACCPIAPHGGETGVGGLLDASVTPRFTKRNVDHPDCLALVSCLSIFPPWSLPNVQTSLFSPANKL